MDLSELQHVEFDSTLLKCVWRWMIYLREKDNHTYIATQDIIFYHLADW